jgi:poly(3-hydroxybutyrate) depolymerase
MKTILFFFTLYLSFSQLSAQEHFIKVHGTNMAYLLYVPKCYDGSSAYPVIFVFHGAGGNDSTLYKIGFNERAEIMGYIAVYPNEYDVDHISVLIDTLKAKYNIDSKRVYATGHSMGGYFSYTLAVKLPTKICAIAPVAGWLDESLDNMISLPMPVIHIHSLDDNTIPFGGWGNTFSVDTLMAHWRTVNQCSNTANTVYNSNGVIGREWTAPGTGADVALYVFNHGGHTWFISPLSCTDLIVDFFYNHPKRNSKVTLTSPVNTYYNANPNIQLSAEVESGKAVTKVEFYANAAKLYETSAAPYTYLWNNVQPNDYIIYVKVIFADGTSMVSSNIKNIHVISPNIALNKPAECSSVNPGNSSLVAQNAFDGDFTTHWSSSRSDSQWISVDLQGLFKINGVTLFWDFNALAFTIDVSNDKKIWKPVYSTTSGKGSNEYISFPETEARYVRIFCIKRGTTYEISLWEFLVHGTFESPDSAPIVVDGLKDQFYNALTGPNDGYLQLRSYAYNNNGAPANDADLSAKIWTAWDDQYFYLYEEVKDNILSGSSADPWNNDCLELKIDPQPTDIVTNSIWDTRLTALGMSTPGVVVEDNLNSVPDLLKQWKRRIIPGGYALELSVNWSAITNGNETIIPSINGIFGMAINQHDNDGNGRLATLQWAAVMQDAVWNTPKYLGTVKFLSDYKLQFIAKNNMTGVTNPIPYDGSDYTYTGIENALTIVPKTFNLEQNFPNPFNPTTNISFSLPSKSFVSLKVFDLLGKEVTTLVSEEMPAGNYTQTWNAANLSSGIYFYCLKAGSFTETKKLVLLR